VLLVLIVVMVLLMLVSCLVLLMSVLIFLVMVVVCWVVPTCGNGVIDLGEDCDGVGYDSVSFTSGDLVCSSSCQLSTESCGGVSGGSCGDGLAFGFIDECV